MNSIIRKSLVFVFSFSLYRCGTLEELPIFDHPMPESAKTEQLLDKKFEGVYQSLTDSAYLIINRSAVIIKDFYNVKVFRSDVDSLTQRIASNITAEYKGSAGDEVQGDSVIQRKFVSDTLFFTSEHYRLKKYKGFYFANKKTFSGKWTVRTLRMNGHGVLVSRLRSKEEIEKIGDYALSEPDSLTHAKLTSDQLKTFLKNDNYPDERKFVRMDVIKF